MANILIVEDEAGISSFVSKGLKAAGHLPTVAATGQDGLHYALTGGYDLIILDIGLPDLDGYQVLERMRGQGVSTPVIILTARSSVGDTVQGLESGADDYMAKPFRFEELLARVKLRLRAETTAGPSLNQLQVGDLIMDLPRHQVTLSGKIIDLSAREFALLEAFLNHPGQVLSREQLLDRVWGYDFDPNSNVVDVYVRYLRRKIGNGWITTVRNMGYRLSEPTNSHDRK
ncbi:response regulator transcription factor [Flaviflexus massiliensis]|uniref:response regulator transcription factor n=1 Tax=Flaviflexus massiliensis TaxID=1522309 RepID=UPI0006D53101|nr:response regulator transcription factor [Flaviflexus massiliensis]